MLDGGALWLYGATVRLSGNDAGGCSSLSGSGAWGSASYSAITSENNVVGGCESVGGGSVWDLENATLTMRHDTVVENRTSAGAAITARTGALVSIDNSILWNPQSTGDVVGASHVAYTCVYDASVGDPAKGNSLGAGIIHTDPSFAGPKNPRLSANSPCIDSGDSGVVVSKDVFGNSRPVDGDYDGVAKPDMGAAEYRDTTAPIAVNGSPVYSPNLTKVTITASDTGGSGVKRIEYKLDGVSRPAVVGAVAGVSVTKPGQSKLEYRAVDKANNTSGWKSTTIAVRPSTIIAFSAPSVSAYASAKVTGTLKDKSGRALSGRSVVIEYLSGSTWKSAATIYTNQSGAFTRTLAPKARTTYRARFAGDGYCYGAISRSRIVLPRVRLTRATSWTSLSVDKTYYAKGYIEPRHYPTSGKVRIYAYRKASNGKYYYKASFAASYSYYSVSKTRYRAGIKLPYRGSWRIRAYHPADTRNAATWGGYDYLTVK